MTDTEAATEPPAHWHADVVLSDGGTVHLRPITPEDGAALLALHSRLSARTLYLRFFGPYPKMPPRDVERFTRVDHSDRVALVATLGDDMIAVGRYERIDDASAEVAFIVQDDQQGRGVGSILLEHLAAAARERGVRRFVAEVLAENGQMVRVFRDAGYQVRREFDGGVLHLEFDIDPTRRSLEVAQAREQAAEARSVRNLLQATSIAVIGASADQSKIGNTVLSNLLRGDFAGPVYPVNPDARSVRGVRAYPSVADIPDAVDLAVVAVPAASVAEVADECLAKGVRALLVITSGFGETGADGMSAERRLATEARAHGMRVVGPNALGVVNNAPDVRMNATLAPVVPGRGRVGFFSQSGALGITILAEAARRGLGLSTFVSAGNRADLSGNDLLQFWQTDADTDVVLLYLESFGNPRKFARLARRLARTKPIIAVKSGRHAGVTRALAETATPIDEASVATLFEQAGVIRVESLEHLFDTALLLSNQPLPAGPRVAVVGNSTALNLLVADAVLANGLELGSEPVDVGAAASPEMFAAAAAASLARDDTDALVAVFVPPVRVESSAYAAALRAVLDDAAAAADASDAAAAADAADTATGAGSAGGAGAEHGTAAAGTTAPEGRASPVAGSAAPDGATSDMTAAPTAAPAGGAAAHLTARATGGGAAAADLPPVAPSRRPTRKPVLTTFLAVDGIPPELAVPGPDGTPSFGSVPSYPGPERAVLALARAVRYAAWRARPVGEFPTPDGLDPERARALVATALLDAPRGRALTDDEAIALLGTAGVELAPFRRVDTEEDCVAAADELGGPVAVKAVGEPWRHRTDLVGVRLDLAGPDAVRAAYRDVTELSGASEVYVQRMAPKGISVAFAVTDDPSFGSLVSFGLHGVVGDLLGDRAYRALPLSDTDAAGLIRSPKAAPLLTGYRGSEAVDLDALADLALRVSRLVEHVPHVRRLSLHPVLASAAGAFVTGAEVTVGPPPARFDDGPRRLR